MKVSTLSYKSLRYFYIFLVTHLFTSFRDLHKFCLNVNLKYLKNVTIYSKIT